MADPLFGVGGHDRDARSTFDEVGKGDSQIRYTGWFPSFTRAALTRCGADGRDVVHRDQVRSLVFVDQPQTIAPHAGDVAPGGGPNHGVDPDRAASFGQIDEDAAQCLVTNKATFGGVAGRTASSRLVDDSIGEEPVGRVVSGNHWD